MEKVFDNYSHMQILEGLDSEGLGCELRFYEHPDGITMNSIAFSKYGSPDVLKKTSVSYPHGFDTRSNVVIKVHASAINPVDKALLNGDLKMVRPVAGFPHIISYDVSGVIAEADEGGAFEVGQPVFARLFGNAGDGKKTPWYRGAMAEYCVADVSKSWQRLN